MYTIKGLKRIEDFDEVYNRLESDMLKAYNAKAYTEYQRCEETRSVSYLSNFIVKIPALNIAFRSCLLEAPIDEDMDLATAIETDEMSPCDDGWIICDNKGEPVDGCVWGTLFSLCFNNFAQDNNLDITGWVFTMHCLFDIPPFSYEINAQYLPCTRQSMATIAEQFNTFSADYPDGVVHEESDHTISYYGGTYIYFVEFELAVFQHLVYDKLDGKEKLQCVDYKVTKYQRTIVGQPATTTLAALETVYDSMKYSPIEIFYFFGQTLVPCDLDSK